MKKTIRIFSLVLALCMALSLCAFASGEASGSGEASDMMPPGGIIKDSPPDVEALVVGHHGSKYSTDREFLEIITPEVALISVGDNSYGHPTDAVLARLAGNDIEVYRTDRQGNILLTVHKGEETYGTEKG